MCQSTTGDDRFVSVARPGFTQLIKRLCYFVRKLRMKTITVRKTTSNDMIEFVQTLELLCIAKVFNLVKNRENVSKSDITKLTNFRHLLRISGHHEKLKRSRNSNKANLWLLTEWTDSTVLTQQHCHDFLDDQKNQIFKLILGSESNFTYLTKVYLGSSGLHSGSCKGSFLYEAVSEDDLKRQLERFFKKCPNLTDLTLESFCNDDILVEVVGHHCPKLKKLVLILDPLTCPDKTRLTDDGLIDFIEDSKVAENLRVLHLDRALATEITPKSLFRLSKLPKLNELGIGFDVFALNPELVSHYQIRLPMIQRLKVSFNLQWSYKSEVFPQTFPNVVHLHSKSLDYPWPSSALIGSWRQSLVSLRTNGKLGDFSKILDSFENLKNLTLEMDAYNIGSMNFWNIFKEEKVPKNKLETLALASSIYPYRYEDPETCPKTIIAQFQAKLPLLTSMTLYLLDLAPHLVGIKRRFDYHWLSGQNAPVAPKIQIITEYLD